MHRILILLCSLLLISAGSMAQDEPLFETGLQFITPEQYQGIPLAARFFAGPLPNNVELAPFATPGHQRGQGSCVGWAVAFALKTHQEERERGWDIATPNHQFSPAFIYNQVKIGSGCRGGSTFREALNILALDGAATLEAFPYDEFSCDRLPSPQIKQRAAEFRIATWRRVNIMDETEVKTHLAAGFPVLIGMPVDDAFMTLPAGSVYQGLTGPSRGGHAMVVVGYDDVKGAFRLLNSWGPGWSDGGRGWISYRGFRDTALEGYVVHDIILPSTITAQTPQIEFETTVLAETPAGTRSITRVTGNHHCSSGCQGEPTRTNYALRLEANKDTSLRNPQVRCIAGPCHGWNAVLFVRLEQDNRSAVASWDVWSQPTTWQLTADEVRLDVVSRFTRREPIGTPFTIISESGAPPPRITGKFPTGESFSFIAGRAIGNPRLRFLGIEVQGPETLYRYESQ